MLVAYLVRLRPGFTAGASAPMTRSGGRGPCVAVYAVPRPQSAACETEALAGVVSPTCPDGNARFASSPPAAIASVSTRGVICQETPHLSLHQPHALSSP